MSPFMVFIKKKRKKKKLTNRINYGKLAARWNGITTCFAIQGSVKVLGRKKRKDCCWSLRRAQKLSPT